MEESTTQKVGTPTEIDEVEAKTVMGSNANEIEKVEGSTTEKVGTPTEIDEVEAKAKDFQSQLNVVKI